MIRFYKDGDQMGISTDAPCEDEFIEEVSAGLHTMIEKREYDHDWQFQLRFWLQNIVDICCAYRGYKNGVAKSIQMFAGDALPGTVVHSEGREHMGVHPAEE